MATELAVFLAHAWGVRCVNFQEISNESKDTTEEARYCPSKIPHNYCPIAAKLAPCVQSGKIPPMYALIQLRGSNALQVN
jgi:hypothetical protein